MGRPTSKIPKIGTKYNSFVFVGGSKLVKMGNLGNRLYILVRCECGKVGYRSLSNLKIGKDKACGCKKGKFSYRNNLSRTKEYRAWSGMIHRCYHPSYKLFHRYGGRGIKVCKRWRFSFIAFLKDMGKCPDPDLSLERVNNDRDYKPSNCTWADQVTQCNNRSTNKVFKINGETKTFKAWCDVYSIKYQLAWNRIFILKFTPIDALTRKNRQTTRKNKKSKI